ncbi:MAG: flippase [Acidobacteria bacterium]|nr:flippase [Acidobacteriota bacterium]
MHVNPDPGPADENTAQPTAGMTTKVVKGTLWTLFGVILPICFSVVTTPLLTRLLGTEGYGLMVLILLIPNYLGFADFGMNIASTRFASAAFAEGAPAKEARIIRTAAAISLAASLPLAAAIIIFSRPILALFNIPEALMDEGSLALKLGAGILVVNFLNIIFNTPALTRLRMDLNTYITAGGRIVGLVAAPIVVFFGGGILGAVAATLGASLATLAGHLFVGARLLPQMAGFSIDRESLRPMIKFGSSIFVAYVAGAVLMNLEKLVLTRVTSVETLAYYSIAAAFAGMMGVVSASMAQSLMPAFSQLQGAKMRPALNALFSRGIRTVLIILLPVFVAMILGARTFFTYWFSPEFGRESTLPFYIIVLGFFFTMLNHFPYTAVLAGGRSDILAKIYWAELIPYLFLVWWLAGEFGAVGAAAAWSTRCLVDSVLMFTLARRVGGVRYVPKNAPQFFAAAGIMLIPLAAYAYSGELGPPVIAIALAAGGAYVFIVLTKVLERSEIDWLRRKVDIYLRPS